MLLFLGRSLDQFTRSVAAPLRLFMLRTQYGPLRPLWRFAYRSVIVCAVALIRLSSGKSTFYLRGSCASRNSVFGLSDIDVIVIPHGRKGDRRARRLSRRLQRLYEWLPICKDIVETSVLTGAELEHAVSAPYQAWATDRRARSSRNGFRFESGARYYGPLRGWRRILGPDLLAGTAGSDREYRWLWAWLDMQFYWKHNFRNCVGLSPIHACWFCIKTIRQLTALWIWLDQERTLADGELSLQLALDVLPDEEKVLRLAWDLRRNIHRAPPAPISDTILFLVRMSRRIASRITEETSWAGAVEVRLSGDYQRDVAVPRGALDRFMTQQGKQAVGTPLPLVDWRARTIPHPPSEFFLPLSGDMTDPAVLTACAGLRTPGLYPALHDDGLLVLATAQRGSYPLSDASFRAVQFPLSDPVSFALLDNRRSCLFPNLPGWSAESSARRSVAAHRNWLREDEPSEPSPARRLGILLNAARGALMLETLENGRPELVLTLPKLAESLAVHLGDQWGGAAAAACESYGASLTTGVDPRPDVIDEFRQAVLRLPAYRSGAPADEIGVAVGDEARRTRSA